ncbi:MAG: hypothetical protein GTN59_11220 [Candidatus Dadabacteria bacterium]|nr:hypothetical protein [Candidatus Dadabacteria bacterium]
MKNENKISLLENISKPWWLIDNEDTISYKLVKKITDACCHLPRQIRKKMFTVIENVVIWFSRFFFVLSHASLKGYLISGKEKHSKKNLKLLFISTKYPSYHIMDLIYFQKPKIEEKFRINFLNKKKIINQIQSDIDAIFIKCDRFYSGFLEKKGFTIIPEWVRMILDISEPLENFYDNLSRSAKEDIKKIKKLGYTYEVSQDIKKLDFFYNKMYVPYVSWRFPETDIFSNFYTMKILFEQGSKILFIKYKNEYIFGGLFIKKNKKVTATYAGIVEGKFEYVKRGVIAASYYYLIKHSKENGAKLIDLGSCRSFVNDGLFNYKRKWGAKIGKSGNECSEIYSFKKCSSNKGIKSFLTNNPFIYLEKNKININACKQKK